MMDPIDELVLDLHRDGRPSLEWVVRWSQGNRDPVQAAWDHSQDDYSMRALLRLARHPAILSDEQEYHQKIICRRGCRADPCPGCWIAIRRAVPVPPTLPEVLAALADHDRAREGGHG